VFVTKAVPKRQPRAVAAKAIVPKPAALSKGAKPAKPVAAKPVAVKPAAKPRAVAKAETAKRAAVPGTIRTGTTTAQPRRKAKAENPVPFWKRKTLEEMTPSEWESLCDGCGRCCLNKLSDEDTGELFFTDVACRLLDHGSCRCKSYPTRFKKVPDCVSLTPKEVRSIDWLPPTCAYDLLAKGKDLYWWHPLVSGDPQTVHDTGVSVRGKVGASEKDVSDDQLENWIVKWPGQVPKAARAKVGKVGAPPKAKARIK